MSLDGLVQRLATALIPALTYAEAARSARNTANMPRSPPRCRRIPALFTVGGENAQQQQQHQQPALLYSHAWLKWEVRDFG